MRPSKGDTLTLNIIDLAFGGKGVAKLDHFVVFVESAVPGDMIEAVVEKVRGNYAEAKLSALIAPSEHRVAPACEHFGYCGGCKWQHVEYAIQKKYKEDQVRQALGHDHRERPRDRNAASLVQHLDRRGQTAQSRFEASLEATPDGAVRRFYCDNFVDLMGAALGT